MTIEEVWRIKKEVSEEIKGKTAEEMRDFFKADVDEFNAVISAYRRENATAK